MPLLEWLERCALPEEAALADPTTRRRSRAEFVSGLVRAGTTTRARLRRRTSRAAVDVAVRRGRRGSGCASPPASWSATGCCGPTCSSTPERAYDEGRALAERWHGQGRTRYAVTPRFSLSCQRADARRRARRSGQGRRRDLVHLARQREPRRGRRGRRGCSRGHRTTSTPTTGTAWSAPRSVFAHNVHVLDRELGLLAAQEAWVAHCPTQQLGPGQRPLPDAPAHRGRRPGRPRLRRRRGHRAVAAQGGAAGVLHAAAAPRAGAAADLRRTCSTSRRAPGRGRPGPRRGR